MWRGAVRCGGAAVRCARTLPPPPPLPPPLLPPLRPACVRVRACAPPRRAAAWRALAAAQPPPPPPPPPSPPPPSRLLLLPPLLAPRRRGSGLVLPSRARAAFAADATSAATADVAPAAAPAEEAAPALAPWGVGFSAAGLLFPYYVGVAETLQKEGVLTGARMGTTTAARARALTHGKANNPERTCMCRCARTRARADTTPLAGASAGSLIAAALVSGRTTPEARALTPRPLARA
jgi:hypothetical protein